MKERNNLKSIINGIDHSIKMLEKERSKLEKKLLNLTKDEKQLYLDKYEINHRKFTKGIPQSKKPSKRSGKLPDNLSLEEVGRIGEECYNKYLLSILDMSFCKVDWINKIEESNKPYDFIVTIGKATFYVDVKTTRGRTNNKVYLSAPEVRFAKSHKPNYHVARLSYWDELRRYKAQYFNVKMLNFDQAFKLMTK